MTEFQAPQPNIPLLRKTVEWAEAEAQKPEEQSEWCQGSYASPNECGTAYCIAGKAVMISVPGAQVTEDGLLEVEGQHRLWHNMGKQVLGLTETEAYLLFEGDNTVEQVREIAERIAERAGERL